MDWSTRSLPVRLGKCGERQYFCPGVVHQRADLGKRRGEAITDPLPGRVHRLGVGCRENHSKHAGDHVGLVLGHVGEQIAREVHPTALMPSALETALQRLHQPGVLVTDHQPDTTEAAPLERGQEPAPEGLILAVADVEAEDLA